MKKRLQKALEDKDFAELIKGSGVSFFLRLGGLAVGFLLTWVIAKFFNADGLGDYVLAITVLSFFTIFSKIGLDTTAIRFIASFASQEKWTSIFHFRKQAVIILSFTSIIASLLMYFLANPIAALIHANARYIELNAFFVLPMAFFMFHYQCLKGLKRIAEFSFFYRMSQGLFSLLAIGVIYQFSQGAEVSVYSYLISVFIVSVLSFLSFRYWLKKRSDGKESAEKEIMSYSTLLKISIPLMLAQSVQYIMLWTDKLMLGNMTTPKEVGIYFTAFKLSMFAVVALNSINSIASPKFAEMFAKNNMKGLKKVVQQSTKMIFWTSVPLTAIFFIFPEFFLGLFGEEFKIGRTAFIIMSCGGLISSFSGSVGNILQMTGNQYIYGTILLLGAIMNVGLNFILIPEGNPLSGFGISGINGAAFASMCSLSFWNLSMVLVIKKKFGFYTFYIPFLKR
ncbi:MAG: flippase [Bacteroidetes bacterium]|nr:flippase [Bacteroidota bacterium]